MSLAPYTKGDENIFEEQAKGRERDAEAMAQVKSQRRWYEAETKKLNDLTLEELEDKNLWENHETAKKFDPDEFGQQTPEERRLDGEEAMLASKFKDARLEVIAQRRLENIVDRTLASKPTLEEKMANLTPEQHRKVWEALQK